MSIAENLQNLINSSPYRDTPQRQVAREIGISAEVLRALLTGYTVNPRDVTVARLARGLGKLLGRPVHEAEVRYGIPTPTDHSNGGE